MPTRSFSRLRYRIVVLTALLGRRPTLDEVYHRDFTGTGKFRVLKLGRPPRGARPGRKPTDR